MPKEKKPNSNKALFGQSNKTGSAIIETTAGLFILLPVFLLLVDIIALVIAQSVNDDLAKQAARYAAQTSLIMTSGTPATSTSAAIPPAPDTNAMTAAAYTAADYYVSNTPYAKETSGYITNATIPSNTVTFNMAAGQVQVITQVQCNLPIPVPFGGPASTLFQAQATEPLVGIQPVAQ